MTVIQILPENQVRIDSYWGVWLNFVEDKVTCMLCRYIKHPQSIRYISSEDVR